MHHLPRAAHSVRHSLGDRSNLLGKCRFHWRMGEKHSDKDRKLNLRPGGEILCVARVVEVAKTNPGMPRRAAEGNAKRVCERFRRDRTELGFRFAD